MTKIKIMKINKHITKTLLKISMVMLLSILWTTTTFANRSPADCTGSGLGILLNVSANKVHIGDTISYSVTVFNGTGSGPVVCDASDITASLVTPDGTNHPITLNGLHGTTLQNGQSDYYPNIVSYIARTQDVKQPDGIMTATASDAGTIHFNDTDTNGGGNQGVNTTVISTPTPPSTPPSIPSSSNSYSGGGGGGSTTYGCKDQNALNYNYFATSNPALCIYTATSTTVSPAIATTTVITTTVIIPKLPKTGFPPKEENIPWNIAILAGVLILVSTSSIVFLRKSKI